MQALLVSTYDLGRQPFGLASPAAWLRRAGVDVLCVDTSRDRLDDGQVARASLVAFYLPMHTATRLTAPLIDHVRRLNPAARLVAYGLYAPLNADWLRTRGVHDVLGPEAEAELVDIATSQPPIPKRELPKANGLTCVAVARTLSGSRGGPLRPALRPPSTNLAPRPIARLEFIRPDRSGLPPLDRYASVQMPDGTRRVVGATDATRGCKHLCRHCPIVPVYGGQFRVVPIDVVVDDIRAQVEAGAEHITFGDPDFLNGPTHARRLVERLAREFPGVTYDVTIKIEHLLQHAEMLSILRRTGCLFITSAVESIDDDVLQKLRKGHTRADFVRVVALCRDAGVTLAPTFVPFTPWTTRAGYVELLEALADLDLVEQVAPIQLAIRLLVTAGSPLLELPDIRERAGTFDPESLIWPWQHADPEVDALQQAVMQMVNALTGQPRSETFGAIWTLARARAALPPRDLTARSRPGVPVISEPWYCCAEPMWEI